MVSTHFPTQESRAPCSMLWLMAFSTKEELIARIEAAFPDVRWDGKVPACPCNCWECQELSEWMRGKRWTEISPDDLLQLNSGPSLFSAEAFDFFLPAVMRGSLVDLEAVDVTYDFTVWTFLPYKQSDRPYRTPEGLTSAQRQALYDWLHWATLKVEEELEYIKQIRPEDKRHAAFLRSSIREEQKRIERYREEVSRLRREYP